MSKIKSVLSKKRLELIKILENADGSVAQIEGLLWLDNELNVRNKYLVNTKKSKLKERLKHQIRQINKLKYELSHLEEFMDDIQGFIFTVEYLVGMGDPSLIKHFHIR